MAFGDSKLKAQQKAAMEDAARMGSQDDDDTPESPSVQNDTGKEKLSFRQKWNMAGASKEVQDTPSNKAESMNVDSTPPETTEMSAGRARVESFRQRQQGETNKGSFNDRNRNAYSRPVEEEANEARQEEGMKKLTTSLDPKLSFLIERVCTFLGKNQQEVDEVLTEALKNPEVVKKEYDSIYNNIVQPKTQSRYKTIEEAQKKNPDRIVFLSVKDGEDKLIGLKKEQFPSFEMYQGTIMQTVDYDRTPFDAPSKLFGNSNEKKNEVKEEKEPVTHTPSRPKP